MSQPDKLLAWEDALEELEMRLEVDPNLSAVIFYNPGEDHHTPDKLWSPEHEDAAVIRESSPISSREITKELKEKQDTHEDPNGPFAKGREIGIAEHGVMDENVSSIGKAKQYGFTSDEDATAFRSGYIHGRIEAAVIGKASTPSHDKKPSIGVKKFRPATDYGIFLNYFLTYGAFIVAFLAAYFWLPF